MDERAHDFAVLVRQLDGADVVSAYGELDLFTAPRLGAVLTGAGLRTGHDLVLDLAGLSSLDSIGIGTIDTARRRCADDGGRTVLVVRPGSVVHRVLHILALHQVMDIVPDLDAATRSLVRDPL